MNSQSPSISISASLDVHSGQAGQTWSKMGWIARSREESQPSLSVILSPSEGSIMGLGSRTSQSSNTPRFVSLSSLWIPHGACPE